MPIIPRGKQEVRMGVNAPVPIGGTSGAREAGESIAQFGEAVTKFGMNQLQADRRLKVDEATNEIRNTVLQANQVAKMSSNPDGSDYQQKANEFAQPRIQEIQNKYGTFDPKVSKEITSFSKRAQDDLNTTSFIQAGLIKEDYNHVRNQKLWDDSANRIRENPSTEMFEAELQASVQRQNDLQGTMSPQRMMLAQEKGFESLATARVQGLVQTEQYGPALALLGANQEEGLTNSMDPGEALRLGMITEGEASTLAASGKTYELPVMTKGDKFTLSNAEATVMRSLDPVKKATYIDHIKAKMKENTEMRLSDIRANMNGIERMAYSGDMRLSKNDFDEMRRQIVSNPQIATNKHATRKLLDELTTQEVVHQHLQIAQSLPKDKFPDLIQKASLRIEAKAGKPEDGDFAVMANRSEGIHKMTVALEGLEKARKEDPALAVQNDGRVATLKAASKSGQASDMLKYNTAILSRQKLLGMPTALLTKGEAVSKAEYIKALPDASNTNDHLAQLQAQYGEHFPQILNEIAKVDKEMADYRAVAYITPQTRTNLIDGIKNQRQIKEAIANDDELTIKSKEVDGEVTNVMSDFRFATLGSANDSGRVEVINSLHNLVAIQAKRDIMQKPGMATKEAVKNAYAQVVSSQYQVLNGGTSSVIAPNKYEAKNIENYLQVYSDPENATDLNIAVPPKMGNVAALMRNSKWITNEDQSGIRLMQIERDGSLQPIFDKYGKPVERKYDEIDRNPGKKVIEKNKNLMQKLFGG